MSLTKFSPMSPAEVVARRAAKARYHAIQLRVEAQAMREHMAMLDAEDALHQDRSYTWVSQFRREDA